jgi:hypothetical protein
MGRDTMHKGSEGRSTSGGRNLNAGKPTAFTTCDLDMQRHYRPRVNVVQRPTQGSGKGYEITMLAVRKRRRSPALTQHPTGRPSSRLSIRLSLAP